MRLQDNGDSFAIWVSARETQDWATRPGDAWPCSTLAGKRLYAAFDTNGLFDLTVNGRDSVDIDSHEFNALVSDFAAERLNADHPCYFVAVGQFRAGE